MNQYLRLAILPCYLLSSSAFAQQPERESISTIPNDQIVAAGIVLKTHLAILCIKKEVEDVRLTSKQFSDAMANLDNDARSFSKSKFGESLRKQTSQMRWAVTVLLFEEVPSGNEAFNELLAKNDIDLNTPDPKQMAELINDQLRKYIATAQLSESILDFGRTDEDRRQKGGSNEGRRSQAGDNPG